MSLHTRSFRFPTALLCAVFAALAFGALFVASPASQARQPAATSDRMFRSVTLVIAYGDDVEKRYGMLPWTEGMTALDAMKLAQAKPAPLGLVMELVGEGDRAFVKSLEGMPNEGGKPGNRNWVYRINDRKGDRSCGVAPLAHGDTLLWQFLPMGEARQH